MTPTLSLSHSHNPIGHNAERIIRSRYSFKDERGQPLETWADISRRVVKQVAEAEPLNNRETFSQAALGLLLERKFIPNTPCLLNAGKTNPQLAACFVLPIRDSIEGIMDHATKCALIHKSGGGTGATFETIRPTGARVSTTGGEASGPVSFMQIVNSVTEAVRQGGYRKGANMGILSVTHPNVLEFIHSKNDQKSLTNFNISVTVTDAFMQAVESNEWYQTAFAGQDWNQPLTDPLTKKTYEVNGQTAPRPGMLYAPDVWRRIIESAWRWGEPGIIFIDEVNRHNHLSSRGPITACNPCSEQFLHPFNACNLGSIDVSRFVRQGMVDETALAAAIAVAVRFLDNVIDVCHWPLPEIAETVQQTRPIGLGLMGFADLLVKLKIKYGSKECGEVIHRLMELFHREAWRASCDLGREKGPFPEFEANHNEYRRFLGRILPEGLEFQPRNYEVSTIAPTGTISLVAETSSGIEPNFDWAYVRRDSIGTHVYVHPLAAAQLGVKYDPTNPESIERAAEEVTRRVRELPAWFVTAHDLTAEDHLRVLAAFQKYVDNGISKTVNGASSDRLEEVDRLYRQAFHLGVKSVAYYRDGSREGQVLTNFSAGTEAPAPAPAPPPVRKERDRPKELPGWTWRIPFDESKIYVTVNHDGERVLEVFATGQGLMSPAVGKLASKMLQSSCFTPEEIAQSLNSVQGTHTVWFNQRCLTSPEQAIAECLLIAVRRLRGEPDARKANPSVPSGAFKRCACGGIMQRLSNCDVCPDCGASKCG